MEKSLTCKSSKKNTTYIKNTIPIRDNPNIENTSLINKIFFKKYKIIKEIGGGSFSNVYEGINMKTNEKIACKIELRNSKVSLLENESIYIFNLQGPGIIKYISSGKTQNYYILIEELLGKSLYTLFLENKKNFSLKEICQIGIQCLSRIEYIHSKGYLHGDIKPENFLIGIKDPRIIYIIDFGLSKKFLSNRTKKHIPYRITKKLTGTARYASMNSLRGLQISRRDDLESLCYMLIYFLLKKLPWQGIKGKTQMSRLQKIFYAKKKFQNNSEFLNLPENFQKLLKYCCCLKFDEMPNYDLLKNYMKNLLQINNFEENWDFFWVKDKNILNNKIEFVKKKKPNSHERLLKKYQLNDDSDENIYVNNNDDKIKNENNSIKNEKKVSSEELSTIPTPKSFCTNVRGKSRRSFKSNNETLDAFVGDYDDKYNEKYLKQNQVIDINNIDEGLDILERVNKAKEKIINLSKKEKNKFLCEKLKNDICHGNNFFDIEKTDGIKNSFKKIISETNLKENLKEKNKPNIINPNHIQKKYLGQEYLSFGGVKNKLNIVGENVENQKKNNDINKNIYEKFNKKKRSNTATKLKTGHKNKNCWIQ